MTNRVPTVSTAPMVEHDPCVGDKTRQQEADKGDDRDGDCVGQLGLDVLDVVAVCAGRGHDGRVGDGGAVVAADSAGQACGDADHQQRIADLEDGQNNGDQDAEGAPACAGRESEQAGNDEDDRREHAEQTGGSGPS